MRGYFLVFLVSVLVNAFYDDSEFIRQDLTPENFADNVLYTSKLWVFEFYAPWCSHCKEFEPEYEKTASNLAGLVNFGAFDCTIESNKPFCAQFQVEAYPTIVLFPSKLELVTIEGKQGYTKKPVSYTGPRKAAQLANWVLQYMIDKVVPVNDKNVDKFTAVLPNIKHKALFFSNKDKTSNILKALALDFDVSENSKQWLPIGIVSQESKKLVDRFQVKNFPSLIIVNSKGEVEKVFDSEFKYQPLYDFLQQYKHTPTEEDLRPPESQPKPPSPSAAPKPKSQPQVQHAYDQESFDEYCSKFGLCLIAFIDKESEDFSTYIDVLNKTAKNFPAIRVLWINGPEQVKFKEAFGVAEGYPQAVVLQRKKLRYKIFRGGFDEVLFGEFLESVQEGKGRTSSLDEMPTFEVIEKKDEGENLEKVEENKEEEKQKAEKQKEEKQKEEKQKEEKKKEEKQKEEKKKEEKKKETKQKGEQKNKVKKGNKETIQRTEGGMEIEEEKEDL